MRGATIRDLRQRRARRVLGARGVQCQRGGQHSCAKRYSEFDALRKELCARHPAAGSADFPPKTWFGLELSDEEKQERAVGLGRWLDMVLAVDAVRTDAALHRFLELGRGAEPQHEQAAASALAMAAASAPASTKKTKTKKKTSAPALAAASAPPQPVQPPAAGADVVLTTKYTSAQRSLRMGRPAHPLHPRPMPAAIAGPRTFARPLPAGPRALCRLTCCESCTSSCASLVWPMPSSLLQTR